MSTTVAIAQHSVDAVVAIAFFAYVIGRAAGYAEGFRRGLRDGHNDLKIFIDPQKDKGTAASVERPERGTPERSTP